MFSAWDFLHQFYKRNMSPTATPGTATTVQETVQTKKTKVQHPLDPLTSDEVRMRSGMELSRSETLIDTFD